MKLIPWLVIILSMSLISCSGSKSAKPVSQETPQIELSDADEFIENPNEEPAAATEDPVVADAPIDENSPEISEMDSPVVVDSSEGSSEKTYQVQKNETLMMIAFKLYGDYGKWKELANYNRDALKGSTAVSTGMKLKYMAPAEEFVWNPQGLPYLIRTGDTLGTISTTVYATPKKWKLIWDNNRPLIKDANKIFAGFTLYYLESGRDVAAEL
ncbi:MAG: LysM peptidoglycan-binding domain-containing protein [Bdellovibrionales bacterium]|nr:LysM peptidoglycan-binding domain-containing protein [Bdellovibrionales bacterium]